jgi:hypothetical protein
VKRAVIMFIDEEDPGDSTMFVQDLSLFGGSVYEAPLETALSARVDQEVRALIASTEFTEVIPAGARKPERARDLVKAVHRLQHLALADADEQVKPNSVIVNGAPKRSPFAAAVKRVVRAR